MPASRQVGLQTQLQCAQPLLFQPGNRRLRERLECQLGQRWPAPQRQRLVEDAGRVLGLSGG
jgi:hypothetical protein